jgi:hypothetical protein
LTAGYMGRCLGATSMVAMGHRVMCQWPQVVNVWGVLTGWPEVTCQMGERVALTYEPMVVGVG